MDRSIRMRTSLSQMIAKGDSNIAQTDAIALAAHKMVKLYVYVVTHLNVRKDSLNARCTMHDAIIMHYYGYLPECSLHSFIGCFLFASQPSPSLYNSQIDNKWYICAGIGDTSISIGMVIIHQIMFYIVYDIVFKHA